MKTIFRRNKFRIDINSKESIDPEDIFSDVASPLFDEVNEKKLEVSVASMRFRIFFVGVFIIFFLFIVYIFYLNYKKGDYYREIAQTNAYQAYEVGPSRGEIFSSDGVALATSDTVFDLLVNPSKIDESQISQLAVYVAENFLEYDGQYWENKLLTSKNQKIGSLLLVKNLSSTQVQNIGNLISEYPSLSLREQSIRYYPYGEIYSHVLGYTSEVTKEELKKLKKYKLSDEIGKGGIEYYFENFLRGINGLFAKFTTTSGEVIKEGLVREIQTGNKVTLTINSKLQEASYNALHKSLQENNLNSGAAIVLDAKSGAILALVSAPSFDPNHFVKGLTKNQAQVYLNSNIEVLFNRATAGEYATGSIIKPIIATAALEKKVIDPNKILFTKGYIEVPSIYDSSIVYRFDDWKNHGAVDMRDAIAVSSNVYFYTIGGGYENQKGLGISGIAEYLRKFNWGEALGINFATEGRGFVPTPDWKQATKNEAWTIGDTYNVSIGQGDVLATPLQVAVASAVFASDGKLFRPFVVQEVYSQNGLVEEFGSDIINENFISGETINIVKEGMREAVVRGSSVYLSSLPHEVAGKTGTAQTSNTYNNAWFSGFGPYDDPEIVVTVLLEAGETSDRAVHVAHDIFNAYFENIK